MLSIFHKKTWFLTTVSMDTSIYFKILLGAGGGRGQMLSIKRVGQVQTTKLPINDVLKILRGEAN